VRLHLLAGVSAIVLLEGCRPRRAEPDPISCQTPPADAAPLPQGSTERLEGDYRVRLVATEGPKSGQATEGTLKLRPHDAALRTVTVKGIRDTTASYVLYGSTDVNLDGIGAVRPGDPESEDPMRPGVLVIERRGTVVLRLGSEANRRDAVRFDGGYTALRVHRLSGDSFAGTWTSGVQAQRSAGYFCAKRVAEGE
jgi:hypothetical protein